MSNVYPLHSGRVNDDNPQAWYIGVDKSEWVNHRTEPKKETKPAPLKYDWESINAFLDYLGAEGYEIRKKGK